MSINIKRWERIELLDINFNYIKKIIKKKFAYEIREISVKDFARNIKAYKNIDEDILLSLIEKNYYKRLSILSMKPLKSNPEFPVHEELTNSVFNSEFKRNNRIGIQCNKEVVGELDDIYKVTYYYEQERFVEIKLAKIINYSEEINNNGIHMNKNTNIYDCYNIIIDLSEKIIFMFYNDLPVNNINNGSEYTKKKKAFYELFTKATQGNILSYIISDSLRLYFLEYMEEIENKDSRKMISLVETMNLIGSKKSTRSIAHEFTHDECSINAIKELVIKHNYSISAIECKINSELVKLKSTGEINIETGIFDEEVLQSVCEEFIDGNEVYDFCKLRY
ncbi:hypothetical protein [Clostridium gasigenes]|uniref:Uncharacterized protein n=1 Tax=Clostridium gasigenes TaxID=94869 RepID=A0A1H0N7N3_9CLOT|nr:hypothetical protein [Clostridium gasigenes]MBB6623845.1 hypothetical protein [Clostridium gasigenes]MBU3131609.1 hypothetical protein [Clostridium gasigenes]SDO88693.1 hypothetical protein SAMN04488529_101725 [Clostridium gasigenes]